MTSPLTNPPVPGIALRTRRQALGWSRRTLATKSGTGEATIYRFENGANVYHSTLEAWARTLGCTIDDITAVDFDDGEATGATG